MADSRTQTEKPRVRVASTLDRGEELVDRIPIGTAQGQKRVVALSIGRSRDEDSVVPELRSGDLLEVSAEIEVTVDLTRKQAAENARGGGKPAGIPYDYTPEISAQLLVASSPTATIADREAVALGKPKLKKVDHELHHEVFVFDGLKDSASLTIPSSGLPWTGQSYINLVLSASHPEAKSGHIVIVGQNNFDGSTGIKMASIAAVRSRPGGGLSGKLSSTSSLIRTSMPIQSRESRVVYSIPLENLKANEQLRVSGHVDARPSMSYPGRLRNEVFLADKPGDADPDGKSHAASISSGKGKVTRGNGFNCKPGVTTRFRKAGVLRITEDATKTLYLNLACSAGDPKKLGLADSLTLLPSGGLTVERLGSGRFG